MTIKQAKRAGYKVVRASPFEVGLVKKGMGVRTWWAKEFAGKLPRLDHRLIQEAIQNQEDLEKFFPKTLYRNRK